MIELVTSILGPYYLQIKFFHVLFATLWLWSTSVAFSYYLVPAVQGWRQNESDRALANLRNWAFERFDHGVVLEHIAFPVVILTGLLMLVIGGWSAESNWLVLKLSIVTAIFIPMELYDYHISHFSGNKRLYRDKGDLEGYEQAIHTHWWFLLITTPIVVVFAIGIVYLAIAKPF